ncbi:hypothetical protein CWB96_03145 [Pseudoalteromonas citrea]|uniref:Uncharacterized protein n=1 Tax=Pseudoalteromonas citrea TaxID=43655 RepID=A0A5S3XV86_9GAMM|nr:hypothetical protein [Pseudoalteromonas citrea]TMP40504.1 hypothetical protein CWB97_18145 [Pseudoalteromonas citrea]TMP61796.1 hypothetical protein CWB96_03145 [Pseudoalteromonas citrea]
MKMLPILLSSIVFSSVAAHASSTIPDGWAGLYKGECDLISPQRGAYLNFAMSLEIANQENGEVSWVLTYGSAPSQSIRNYNLLTIDETKGHYAIDENNGIIIDQFLVGNEFVSMFEIGSSKIQTTYALNSNGTLDVSMDNFTFETIRDAKVGPYTVANYGVKVKQKCRLYKW